MSEPQEVKIDGVSLSSLQMLIAWLVLTVIIVLLVQAITFVFVGIELHSLRLFIEARDG